MRKTLVTLLFLCCSLFTATAQKADYNVVPLPQETRLENGAGFVLDGSTVIAYSGDKSMKRNAQFLAEFIKESTGLDLKIAKSKKAKENATNLVIDNTVENKEGYCMTVTKNGVSIAASSPSGVFYGIQTLHKSLPVGNTAKVTLPAATITDYPRFSYRGAPSRGWRR